MTTGKTIALTRWTFVDKVLSLLFKMPSRFVIAFLPRKDLLSSKIKLERDTGLRDKVGSPNRGFLKFRK